MDWMDQVDLAREAANSLKLNTTEEKNKALEAMSKALVNNISAILEANKIDMENAKKNNIAPVMLKRLELTEEKIKNIANDILNVMKLDDPVNKVLDDYTLSNGLRIQKITVPLGVIGVVYESRPNVSVDIATLCIKSGNACLLKGGKEAFITNLKLVEIMQEAIKDFINPNAVQLIKNNSREVVRELICLKGKIDLVVPRGSKNLINFVTDNTLVPYIETGAGVCHIYVDESADQNMALNVIKNAKLSNPAVCNAVECILINEKIAKEFLPKVRDMFNGTVKFNGESKVKEIIDCNILDDYGNEYDDLVLDIKIVKDTLDAINHIEKYGTHHSDSIITSDKKNMEDFLNKIDSACVYVNASTRFTDGGCFGMGAELGISTQKLHARGPMALKEMTTYKYKIFGNGQVR